MERGSLKHVLDWTERPEFLSEFESTLSPIPVSTPPDALYMPRGYSSPTEARLERFCQQAIPGSFVSEQLQGWWLAHTRGANTPNWDIASTCTIEGRAGLVLVEAKANWQELGRAGKRLNPDASANSLENHERIGAAIAEARDAWKRIDPRIAISRDTHYQLSNRLAFAWKLATLGIPVVLVYLGFTGDDGIWDAGAPFTSDEDWRNAFGEYSEGVFPVDLFDARYDVGGIPVWLALRSRPVFEYSLPIS